MRRAARTTGASTIFPSTTQTPPPATSIAATTRDACATSVALGVKAALIASIWRGWMASFPVNPIRRARALSAELGGAPIARADLTQERGADGLLAEARERFGRVDVCAAVAGVYPSEDVPVWELGLERFERTILENLTATFLTARAFLRGLTDTGVSAMRSPALDAGPRTP